jgi:two-component sensor histidine kinase
VGERIKRILRSRLPERVSGKLPPLLVELAVGVGLPLLVFAARLLLYPWIGEAAPLAPLFVALVAAAVLAGWRAALITLVVGQVLVWTFIMSPRGVFGPKDAVPVNALIVVTLAELFTIAILALYQREVALVSSRRESQLGLLEKALKEIDHRTSNNYQTVLALVIAQANSAEDGAVKEALQQVADRIRAIASASQRLAVSSESLEEIRIAEHLHDLCNEIEKGLSRPGIRLDCEFEDIVLGADRTVSVSILVNELVTNALKHAFPDDRCGMIRVSLSSSHGSAELVVEDDGIGMGSNGRTHGSGLGTRLVETFVRQLSAKHEVAAGEAGTRHRIRFRK